MRFTKPNIAALLIPDGKSELLVFDDALPGFGIRLRAGGKRVWVVQYRVGTKQRRLTLGRADVLELDQARISARQALSKVGLAIDPQTEKNRARASASVTLGTLVKRHLAVKKTQLKPRSYVEVLRHLERDWSPLHGQPLASLGRIDIANRLGALVTENGPVAADRARAALSSFFGWAVREGLAERNPVIGTNRPSVAKARDRVLSDPELVEIWKACKGDTYGAVVKLLLLTGQRREEIAGLRWSELDLRKAIWSIPASRTKNGRPHEVPLSDTALEVLAGVARRSERDLLFGEGDGGFSGWSRAKASLDKRIAEKRPRPVGETKAKPLPAWRIHDLRRTMATRLGDLGVQPHIIEAVLNHISGAKAGVAGTYNRSLYAGEKRAALVLWASHISGLINGATNVLYLAAGS